jgi:hypothetical protein
MKKSGAQKYPGALLAIQRLDEAIGRQTQRTAYTGPTMQAEAGGVIAVDLDEAIHGLYTAIAYTKNASVNGFDGLGKTLTRDANLWAQDPKSWLTQSAMPHGAADIGIAGVVTVALVPFALMALHAGIAEMRESRLHGNALKQELDRSRTFLQTLEEVSASLDAAPATGARPTPEFRNMVDAAKKICAQQLDDLELARKNNRDNGHIGACSGASGGTITAMATLKLGGQVGYLALAGNAAGATLATAAGTAGVALAPIAAVSAFLLGAKMVKKSNAALQNFAPVCEQLQDRLASDTSLSSISDKVSGKHNYLEFLPKKLAQRLRFFRSYERKNGRFLFGSALYAGGAITSFGLTAAALLGAGVALGPIGMGVLLAVGITGGLLMGRYSTQFLFGHGRMHRYENNSIGDDPELDSRFLDSIETFTDKEGRIPQNSGIALRAAFYEQAGIREELRQDFLSDVAGELEKRYHGMLSYSTDSEEVRAKRGGAPGKWHKWDIVRATAQKKYESVTGHCQAGMHYLGALLQNRGHAAAKEAAATLRQDIKPYLSVGNLHEWLAQPQNYAKQIALMHDSLDAQIGYMRDKSALRVKMYVFGNSIDTREPQVPAPASTTATATLDAEQHDEQHDIKEQTHAFLEQLAAPLVRDADILGQAENLHAELERYRTNPLSTPDDAQLSKITSRFLKLQCGKPCDPTEETPDIRQSQAALAHHYLKEAPGRYRNLRGLLVAAELRATRLTRPESAEPILP